MLRTLLISAAIALLPGLVAAPAHAGKNKVSLPEGTVIGAIKSVSDDGTILTIERLSKKKKKVAKTTDVKITKDTKIVYDGIEKKDEQKLQVGYGVAVQLDDKNKDTAASIKVTKTAALPRKKKKNS